MMDGCDHFYIDDFFPDRYFNTQLEPMDATVGGVSSLAHEHPDPTSSPSN